MRKLSKEKRNQLILVALFTIGAIAGLWFMLISAEREKIREISAKIEQTRKKIDEMRKTQKASTDVESELNVSAARLTDIENTMPSGDPYLWMINTLKKFNVPAYKVDMPSMSAPTIGATAIPGFHYHQMSVQVAGSAYFYDFGRFLADFENHFPYMRVQNLSLEPGGGTTVDDREKLTFRMEIITLIKPNTL